MHSVHTVRIFHAAKDLCNSKNYRYAVESRTGWTGCGNVVGDEVQRRGGVDVWRSCSCVRLALSSGQEMAAVSAVSLTVNEFPGGGVVYVGVDGCLNTWGGNRGKTEGKRRKKIEPPGCSGNLCTPSFKASKQEELLSQCIRLKLPAHCTKLCRHVCD